MIDFDITKIAQEKIPLNDKMFLCFNLMIKRIMNQTKKKFSSIENKDNYNVLNGN